MTRLMQRMDDVCVYVVDDDASVLRSLCALLSSHGYQTVACESADAFLLRYEPDRTAVMLLDVRMPGMSGMDLQAYLKRHNFQIPVIILTGHGDVQIAVRAMKAGAVDFIEKPSAEGRLLEAIRDACRVAKNRGAHTTPADVVAKRVAQLTQREREVLDHLVLGKTNKEIATELGISQRTIEIHRARVREKMKARGISDLIRMMS